MAIKIYNTINRGIRIRENGVFTGPELIADAGKPMEGGYYAGGNIMVDGKEYYLIIAPKAEGQISAQWTTDTGYVGAISTYDGRFNTEAMITADPTGYPAAEFCVNLNINGYDDWHLPSPDELEICYRYLKPSTQDNNATLRALHNAINGTNPNSNPEGSDYTMTNPSQTSVELFLGGGSEAFETDTNYWTSMRYGTTSSWTQHFGNGYQGNYYSLGLYWTRAVRWVEV